MATQTLADKVASALKKTAPTTGNAPKVRQVDASALKTSSKSGFILA